MRDETSSRYFYKSSCLPQLSKTPCSHCLVVSMGHHDIVWKVCCYAGKLMIHIIATKKQIQRKHCGKRMNRKHIMTVLSLAQPKLVVLQIEPLQQSRDNAAEPPSRCSIEFLIEVYRKRGTLKNRHRSRLRTDATPGQLELSSVF